MGRIKITQKDIGKIVLNNMGNELIIVRHDQDEVDGNVFLVSHIQYNQDTINPNYWVTSSGMAYELDKQYSIKNFK